MSLCPGCRNTFRPGGLLAHLNQTTNPRCQAERERLNSFIPSVIDDWDTDDSASVSASEDGSDRSDIDMDAASPPFSGDLFGQYDPEEDVEDVGDPIIIDTDEHSDGDFMPELLPDDDSWDDVPPDDHIECVIVFSHIIQLTCC